MKKGGGRWEDAAGGGNSNNPQTTYCHLHLLSGESDNGGEVVRSPSGDLSALVGATDRVNHLLTWVTSRVRAPIPPPHPLEVPA